MVKKSLFENMRITAWTLVTLMTSAALVAMFTTMSFDLGKKMTSTLRRLGPNAVAVPHHFEAENRVNANPWEAFETIVRRKGIQSVKLSFEIVTVEGKPVVFAVSQPERLAAITPYWFIFGRRAFEAGECLIGKRVAEFLKLKPGMFLPIRFRGGAKETTDFKITGILVSGDENENRIFVPESPSLSLNPVFSYVLLSVPGGEEEIRELNGELRQGQSSIQIKPLREILHGEKSTIKKIVLLSSVSLLAVLLLTVLGISSALLARIVERRKEFALLQAIGATTRSLVGFLLLEITVIGITASVLGFVFGTLISEIIVRHIFYISVTPQFIAIPVTLLVTLGVSLLAGSAGVMRALRLEPAPALRGE